MVSRSWINLHSLNSSFSFISLGCKSASMFLEGDWQPSFTLSPGGWTPSLPISVVAFNFLSNILPGSSNLEAADFTTSDFQPRVALQFSSKKAKLSVCASLVVLGSARSGEATTLPMVKCSLSVTVACHHTKNHHQTQPALVGAAKMVSGFLGPLESAALLSLTSEWSGF